MLRTSASKAHNGKEPTAASLNMTDSSRLFARQVAAVETVHRQEKERGRAVETRHRAQAVLD